MKILLTSFLYGFEGGGASFVVENLAENLVQHGYEITILTTGKCQEYRVTGDGIKIYQISPKNFYWVKDKDHQPAWKKILWQIVDTWNPLVYRAAKEILRKESPDIVHTHKLRGLSPALWSAAKAAGMDRIVHTCHDFEILSPRGLLEGRLGQWARGQSPIMRPYQSVRRSLSRQVKTVTFPSRYVHDVHSNLGFFPRAYAEVIPNTHGFTSRDLLDHQKTMNSQVEGPLRLLYLGRLEPEKGVGLAVGASAGLPGVEISVAGWGSMEPALAENSQVRWLGALQGKEKFGALAACDILVVPSIVPENFPVVVAEAFAFGKPVLAARIGGLPELVDEEETGWLVEPGSLEAWRAAIKRVASEKLRLANMAAACYSRANEFTVERITGRYESLYTALS